MSNIKLDPLFLNIHPGSFMTNWYDDSSKIIKYKQNKIPILKDSYEGFNYVVFTYSDKNYETAKKLKNKGFNVNYLFIQSDLIPLEKLDITKYKNEDYDDENDEVFIWFHVTL